MDRPQLTHTDMITILTDVNIRQHGHQMCHQIEETHWNRYMVVVSCM